MRHTQTTRGHVGSYQDWSFSGPKLCMIEQIISRNVSKEYKEVQDNHAEWMILWLTNSAQLLTSTLWKHVFILLCIAPQMNTSSSEKRKEVVYDKCSHQWVPSLSLAGSCLHGYTWPATWKKRNSDKVAGFEHTLDIFCERCRNSSENFCHHPFLTHRASSSW